jgi:myo-inositol 2-dehydrogenase/D-chiro-inositol 1-dehydrogenase
MIIYAMIIAVISFREGMMVSIAVLGCGRIGRMHADNIAAHPRAMLAGVFDVDEPAAVEVSGNTGSSEFASADDVFASAKVDAVLIATSTPTHVDFIEKGVRAGQGDPLRKAHRPRLSTGRMR